ncbi:MAG TPA: protein-disulfide reductase DsbD domain-containing protein [Pyrinomonadaceae bacterium]
MNRGYITKLKGIMFGLPLICAACGGEPKPSSNVVPATASPVVMPAISRKVSSADVVKAAAPNIEIAAGGSAEAEVRMAISEGYHINANPPTFPYLIATAVEAGPSKGITTGKPIYPTPVTKKFSFAEKPLSVYEGDATIKLPLQASGDAAKGARVIGLILHVQACDDSTCYAPAAINSDLHLTVK